MAEPMDLDAQPFEALRSMAENDDTRDLVFAINRWSSLKRSMNDGASLVRVLVAKVRPYWQGQSGDEALAQLDNLATWMAAVALQADKNSFATEQVHTAVLTAQRRMRNLAARPNKAPATTAIAKDLDGTATPADLDSRQPEAARIIKQLALAYDTHTPNLREVPPNPNADVDSPKPGGVTRGFIGGHDPDDLSRPLAVSNPGAGSPPDVSGAGNPGPTLAGGTTAPPAPTETAGVVRPPAGPPPPVNTLPGGAGIAPTFGGRGNGTPPTIPSQGTSGSRTGTPNQPATNANARAVTNPSGTTAGKPGMPGGGIPSSGSGGPNDRRGRRGSGTDLIEDRPIFQPNRHHAPPVIGTPRQLASSVDDDLDIPIEPMPVEQKRDEKGYPTQIPDHEITNKDGLRVQFKRSNG